MNLVHSYFWENVVLSNRVDSVPFGGELFEHSPPLNVSECQSVWVEMETRFVRPKAVPIPPVYAGFAEG